jgi:hypothetical protein
MDSYGAMALSGMAVLLAARNINRELFITETHPKILYWSLIQQRYDYETIEMKWIDGYPCFWESPLKLAMRMGGMLHFRHTRHSNF